MNVALTRSKGALIIVGNFKVLSEDPVWRTITNDFIKLGCLYTNYDRILTKATIQRPCFKPDTTSRLSRAQDNQFYLNSGKMKWAHLGCQVKNIDTFHPQGLRQLEYEANDIEGQEFESGTCIMPLSMRSSSENLDK